MSNQPESVQGSAASPIKHKGEHRCDGRCHLDCDGSGTLRPGSAAVGLTTEDVENMLDRASRILAAKAAMAIATDPARFSSLLDLSSRIDDVINDLQKWSDG